ncbi:MAG: hypothetical protein P9L93_07590 [Candidatus Gorgyraea atricola]|nr:hypothetical protein [Candidatus Gorgyraea atricola]
MIKKAYYIAFIFTLIFSSPSYALRAPLKFGEESKTEASIKLSMRDLADNPDSATRLVMKEEEAIPGTRSVVCPENEQILIFEKKKNDALVYQGDLISKLRCKNNVAMQTLEESTVSKILSKFKPTIIMIPDKIDTEIREIIEKWTVEQGQQILGMEYETKKSIEGDEMLIFYTENEWPRKEKSIHAHGSQNKRIDFARATKVSNMANGVEKKQYGEVFTVRMMENGEWKAYNKQKELLFSKGTCLLAGIPHMDDLALALFILAQKFKGNVINFNMTTGHRAYIDGIDDKNFKEAGDFTKEQIGDLKDASVEELYLPKEWKEGLDAILINLEKGAALSEDDDILVKRILSIKIRERETIKSDAIIGIKKENTIFNRFPFYDYIGGGGERLIGKDVLNDEIEKTKAAIENACRDNSGKLVIAIPSLKDKHPDHVATYYIFEEALKFFTAKHNVSIPVVLFAGPWVGSANLYNFISSGRVKSKLAQVPDILKKEISCRQEAYGITGGELVGIRFGARPLEALKRKFAERVNVFWWDGKGIGDKVQQDRSKTDL